MPLSIGVCANYLTPDLQAQFDAAAESAGCRIRYYNNETDLIPHISHYEILYGHMAPDLLKQAVNLRWFYCDYAGVDPYLTHTAPFPPGCLLSNASGAYGLTISEHILMVLLMLFKRIPEYLPELSAHRWTAHSPIRSIAGSHFILLGTGNIGRTTAKRLKALDARLTGVCRSGRCPEMVFDRILPVEQLDDILPQADGVVLSLPATKETIGIMSRERIGRLPPQAVLVNVGRGSAIDQAALVEALENRRIAGAALDVTMPEPLPPDHPLWHCPNTIITPHISGKMSLEHTCRTAVELFCADLPRYVLGKPMQTLVDLTKGY